MPLNFSLVELLLGAERSSTLPAKVATIGGAPTPVLFPGLTPTLGLYQVNVQLPAGVTPGSAVPVVVTATDPETDTTALSNTVTIVVQ